MLTLALVMVGNRGEGEFVRVSLIGGLPLLLGVSSTEFESMGEGDMAIDDEVQKEIIGVAERGGVALCEVESKNEDEIELEPSRVLLPLADALMNEVAVAN